MNDKIKYIVTIKGLRLGFQVLEMDERFRATVKKITYESRVNDFKICSDDHPDIYFQKNIYLRGLIRDKDFSIIYDTFLNREAMFKFIKNLDLAIDDCAENWEGFQGKAVAVAVAVELDEAIEKVYEKVNMLEETVEELVRLSHNHPTKDVCFDNNYGVTGKTQL